MTRRHNVKLLQIVLLAAGLALMAVGVILGETADIVHKAAVVCLECIGIG